jgi:hypothetical protein
VLKKEVTKDKVLKPVKVTKEVVSTKPMAKKKTERLLVKSTSHEENEIGKDLTLESIENADVSDEEKERMIDDIAYRLSLEKLDEPSLSEEEILELIEKGLPGDLNQ